MAKTYNKMRLDVSGGFNDIVTEVQGDQNSRYLDIYLFNNGIPIDLTGHTVRIYMRRPNTNPLEEFFNDGEITEAERGRCQFLLSTQALEKEGELQAQVSIWKGTEEILSTQVFKINVTTNLRTKGSAESSNEYGALVVLFQNLYEAYDLMTTMVENIGSPSEIAAQYNLATMWQAWEFLTDYMKTDLTQMIEHALANASVQGVLDKIGATDDMGGSATAGTLMAKENAVLNYMQNDLQAHTIRILKCQKAEYSSPGTMKPFSITGKGRLYGLVASDTNALTTATIVKLTIDGVTYTYNIKTSNIYNSRQRSLVICAPENMEPYFGYTYSADFYVELEDTTCSHNSYPVTAFMPIEDYIEFNESLEITITARGEDTFCELWYTLEE